MCNRLPEINKNGDAGIFPVYYSLKTALKWANFLDSGTGFWEFNYAGEACEACEARVY